MNLTSETAIDLSTLPECLLAGKAILTVVSKHTGDHVTYKIKKANKGSYKYFVSVKTGEGYQAIGNIDAYKMRYHPSYPQSFAVGDHRVTGFVYVWKYQTQTAMIEKQIVVHHAGLCLRCGRTLTDPESIKSGLGPECAKKTLKKK